jgi:hypothetical protein
MRRLIAVGALFFCLGAMLPVHHKWGHQYKRFDYLRPPATCGELHTLLKALERKKNAYRFMGKSPPLNIINQSNLLARAFRSNCAEV